MSIQPNYRNAVYFDDEGTVNCEIDHPYYGWVPYTCKQDDTDETIDNSYLFAQFAENGDVAAYVAPTDEELNAAAAAQVRQERAIKLESEVDPIAGNSLRWAELTEQQKSSVSDYRNSLLNVTAQSGFPRNIDWPVKPSFI